MVADPIEMRRAEVRDVVHIMDIDRLAYPTPWSRRLVTREVTSGQRVHLVAQRRFDLLGHGGIILLDDAAHVTTIAVHPDHRRNGVGHDLMLSLFRGAIANGCSAVTLEVRSDNSAALSLYRRFGMRPAGVRRGYYGDTGDDALVLWSPDFDADYRRRLASMRYHDSVEVSAELRAWQPVDDEEVAI